MRADVAHRRPSTAQSTGSGNGPIDAFVDGLRRRPACTIRVLDYHEHAIGSGADAQAVAYLELRIDDAQTLFGVGIDAQHRHRLAEGDRARACERARAARRALRTIGVAPPNRR